MKLTSILSVEATGHSYILISAIWNSQTHQPAHKDAISKGVKYYVPGEFPYCSFPPALWTTSVVKFSL